MRKQRYSIRPWNEEKNLAFSENTCLEKERVRSKVTPRKVGMGLKRRRKLNKRRMDWRLAWWGSTEKKKLGFARIERKTPVLRPAIQSNQSSLCGLHRNRNWGGGRSNGQIVSIKREADGRRQRSRKSINEEKEKYWAKNGFLQNTLTYSKETAFVILINHASALIRKERWSPTSKPRREASQNEFVEKDGVPDRVNSFREINNSEDRPRAWLGFIKPIRNGLRKEQNLIYSRPSRA